jgi:HSP20 family molecular chaperone IbpA
MMGELQPWFAGWPTLDRFRKEIDALFTRFFGEGYRSAAGSILSWPNSESYFKDGNWVMRLDLPGVDSKDIDVSVVGDTLTVRASRERRSDRESGTSETNYARFEHSVTLPMGVKGDEIKANYQNGVLELSVPVSPELMGRKIPVESGKDGSAQIEHHAA